ncbi:MAG: hypothetical protein V4819_19295 [Verrucomicrobiota bacterium]
MKTLPAYDPAERDAYRLAKHRLLTNAALPETDLRQVANHDFSRLALPILVACRDREQFEEFTFREGLICSEVKRLRGSRADLHAWSDSKVLVLLPAWHEHENTQQLVDEWVCILDRYTVELRSPRPLVRKRSAFGVITWLSAIGWAWFIAWLLTRR